MKRTCCAVQENMKKKNEIFCSSKRGGKSAYCYFERKSNLFTIRILLYNLLYFSYIFNEEKIKADVLAFFTSKERDVFRGESNLQFDFRKLLGELNFLD